MGEIQNKNLAVSEKVNFTYVYDFGDDWKHEIFIEKILPPEHDIHYPIYLDGKRACPPEDCDGIWDYDNLLEINQDPEAEEFRFSIQRHLIWMRSTRN